MVSETLRGSEARKDVSGRADCGLVRALSSIVLTTPFRPTRRTEGAERSKAV